MNKDLRKIINSHCHRVGIDYGLKLRDSIMDHVRLMESEGKTSDEIAEALGLGTKTGFLELSPPPPGGFGT